MALLTICLNFSSKASGAFPAHYSKFQAKEELILFAHKKHFRIPLPTKRYDS